MAPNVLIEEDNPLTNCWITDPNGQFSATVNGMVGGYTFEWYIGTDTTGTPDHVEATYSGLSPQSYTLVVTDNLTRCAAVRSVDLTDSTIAPPVADPEVVQHLLSCVELDGWVRASVGGNTIDYNFAWVELLRHYYRLSGDGRLVSRLWPVLQTAIPAQKSRNR